MVSCVYRKNMKSYFFKILLLCFLLTILIIIYSSIRDVIDTKVMTIDISRVIRNGGIESDSKIENMKYILQWTSDSNVPFVYMGKGREGFITRKCSHTNCFVTSNINFLGDYTKFDVIAFAGPELSRWDIYGVEKPMKRSPHQKYVFASIESADNYPLCTNKYDNFFNWTWTYKIDSEVHWGYIVIRDLQNNIIGPKKSMNWLKPREMKPVSEEFKNKLKSKRRAAAWFASNCLTLSAREMFVKELNEQLNKYICGESVCSIDIYGECGTYKCSRDREKECDQNIEITYYFYLSLENALSEDYVTEKLLRALNNDAVPIVFGGANYTRFLPEGSYLDGIKLGVENLAQKMYELMRNPEEYASYFKWKNHYSYHKTGDFVDTNEYCKFCEILNNEKLVKEVSVYSNFKEWWDPSGMC